MTKTFSLNESSAKIKHRFCFQITFKDFKNLKDLEI